MTDPAVASNTDPAHVTVPEPESQNMTIMLQMQKQQLEMQKQITNLMTQMMSGTHHPTLIPTTQQQQPLRTQPVKLNRPTIDAESTDNKWVIFLDAFQRYKEMAKLTGAREIKNELRSAYSPAVNEMLFNFVGPDALENAGEEELLKYIKSVAVKAVHPEVYSISLF